MPREVQPRDERMERLIRESVAVTVRSHEWPTDGVREAYEHVILPIKARRDMAAREVRDGDA